MMMEKHPDWVLIVLDLRNAFNELKRQVVLREIARVPELAALLPLLRAELSPESWLNAGHVAELASCEGMQQGHVFGTALFSIGIHPEVCALDAAVAALTEGAGARFAADDGFVFGPPCDALWAAVEQFGAAMAPKGLDLQITKSACWSPRGDLTTKPASLPIGTPAHFAFDVDGEEEETEAAEARGILIFKVPVGDDAFVRAGLRSKARGVCSSLSQTCEMLDSALHGQHLWAALFYSLSHKFDFWLRNSYPSAVQEAAEMVDAGLRAVAEAALQNGLEDGSRALRRLRLPARMQGGGIRQQSELSHAAFVGGLSSALPSFLDVHDDAGALVKRGLFPGLASVLAEPSPPVPGQEPLAVFLSSGLPTALELTCSWERMRQRADLVGLSGDAGREMGAVLGQTPGVGVSELGADAKQQSILTKIVERRERAVLAAEFEALPVEHRERTLFRQLDRGSSTWVSSLPDEQGRLSGQAFAEVGAAYFFLPSPTLRAVVGHLIPGRQPTRSGTAHCDAYGDALLAATLTGAGQTHLHDTAKTCVYRLARSVGVVGKTEAQHVFRSALPPRATSRMDEEGRRSRAESGRERYGYVPDLLLHLADDPAAPTTHARLLEVKTVLGAARYRAAGLVMRAVDSRAGRLKAEYSRKLHKKDVEWCGTAENGVGPLENVLKSHGALRGLVFGRVGEASKQVHDLIGHLAHLGAAATASGEGGPSPAHVGRLRWHMRRALAMAHWRGLGELICERKSIMTQGGRRPRCDTESVGVGARTASHAYARQQAAR
jgi:hypothetical protein